MASILSSLLFTAAFVAFGWHRVLAYLRYFQQEEYTEVRYRTWLHEKRAYDRRGLAVCLIIAVASSIFFASWLTVLLAVIGALLLIVVSFVIEEDPRRSGKLKLNMTQRASKIYLVAFSLFVALTLVPPVIVCLAQPPPWAALVTLAVAYACIAQTPPWLLMIANRILWPAEKRLQEHFKADAVRTLAKVNPFIIGVTGSYGKTGAKAALGELLGQTVGPTFWPRKSINTVMGITRDIRENMRSFHRYAVIEMGAYKIGSIRTLCQFTPPKAALVTAVGIMHLERFGSEENVYRAKSELPQAVPTDGMLVLNGDNAGARRMAADYPHATTLLYGLDATQGHLDCHASNVSFDTSGTRCTIHFRGTSYAARTPLLGRAALSNALGAFTMACALGADPAYAVACLANLTPVDNRLVLDRKGPVAYLRDAYNSNPTGFAAALEVLKGIEAKRRILMTPGMVELGERQFEENRRIAQVAASVADLVIVVGTANREALVSGLRDGGYAPEKTIVVDTRDQAFERLNGIQSAGDVILIENDLGDLLEGRVRF